MRTLRFVTLFALLGLATGCGTSAPTAPRPDAGVAPEAAVVAPVDTPAAEDDIPAARPDVRAEKDVPAPMDAPAPTDVPPALETDAPAGDVAETAVDACAPSPERCNGLDDDCDGQVDEGAEADAACVFPGGAGACRAGRCVLARCEAERRDCDGDPANGCETAVRMNNDHCGACGVRCGYLDACVRGVCGPFTDLDVGMNHACAVHQSGGVVCWGRNAWSQLGDGTRVDRAVPVEVRGLPDAVTVRVGDRYSCAITADRLRVFCWGKRELGNEPAYDAVISTPTAMVTVRDALPLPPFRMIFAGTHRFTAVTDFTPDSVLPSGFGQPVFVTVYPSNALGQGSLIGPNLRPYQFSPFMIPLTESRPGPDLFDFSIGYLSTHPNIVTRPLEGDGTPTCTIGRERLDEYYPGLTAPCLAAALRDDRVAIVSYQSRGEYIGSDVFHVAMNGLLIYGLFRRHPARFGGSSNPTTFERLAGGDRALCYLGQGDDLWRCSRIVFYSRESGGVVAEGLIFEQSVFTPVPFLPRELVRLRLFREGNGGCFLTVGGRVQCWGDNRYGRLGDGTSADRAEPVLVLGR